MYMAGHTAPEWATGQHIMKGHMDMTCVPQGLNGTWYKGDFYVPCVPARPSMPACVCVLINSQSDYCLYTKVSSALYWYNTCCYAWTHGRAMCHACNCKEHIHAYMCVCIKCPVSDRLIATCSHEEEALSKAIIADSHEIASSWPSF